MNFPVPRERHDVLQGQVRSTSLDRLGIGASDSARAGCVYLADARRVEHLRCMGIVRCAHSRALQQRQKQQPEILTFILQQHIASKLFATTLEDGARV